MLVQNALKVKAMDKKLLPTFILREYGVEVNDMPNINIEDPKLKTM